MPLVRAHSFLVRPGKSDETQHQIGGVLIPKSSPVFNMLSATYEGAATECDIDIVFTPQIDGAQANDCRTLFVVYAQTPSLVNGRAVAERLQRVTTHRSGLGLLFIATGSDVGRTLMVSRFPADEAIVAEEQGSTLQVAFLERVFMKTAHSYKSAIYGGEAVDGGFWVGKAVDKQINAKRELSAYWITDFLQSQLSATSAAATKRLAIALRTATKSVNYPTLRHELVSASTLMRNRSGITASAHQICQSLALSEQAVQAIKKELTRADSFEEAFRFDIEEFDKWISFRSIQLDNGAYLAAESRDFDRIFDLRELEDNQTEFTTRGEIIKEELRKRVP